MEKKRKKMPTTIDGYEDLLMEMVEERTGSEFDMFLLPQVQTCAQTWMTMNKVHKELQKEKLVDWEWGSKDQQKKVVNPLLPYYLKLQAELRLQFEALGLNYRATPSKIKEDTRKGVDTEKDGLTQLLTDATKADVPDID